ncbi:hypothetical protein [Holzapfeliella floricola]|uniref:Uncharacterized protein n=2 Tax=Holzapfeliella TaxID=2767883 RepID=A0A0R2DKN3_9LACO|nr:hypothetical protein [Holzapfeliella floricola]KRN04638.1 hypothetical protein FC86_GL000086 [Holzapfeliella floricola DSM 23037 = JCM 16512]
MNKNFFLLIFSLMVSFILLSNYDKHEVFAFDLPTQQSSMGFMNKEYTTNLTSNYLDSNKLIATPPTIVTDLNGDTYMTYEAGYLNGDDSGAQKVTTYNIAFSDKLLNNIDNVTVRPLQQTIRTPYESNQFVTDSTGQRIFSFQTGITSSESYQNLMAKITIKLKKNSSIPLEDDSYIATYVKTNTYASGPRPKSLVYRALRISSRPNRLKQTYDELVSSLTPSFIKDNASKTKLIEDLTPIYNAYTKKLEDKVVTSNQDIEEIEKIADEGIKKMKNVYDNFIYVSIKPDAQSEVLDFGKIELSSQTTTYPTINNQYLRWEGFSMKSKGTFTIYGSISDLYMNGTALSANYLFDKNIISPNTTFRLDSLSLNGTDRNFQSIINKRPADDKSIQLIVPGGTARIGEYRGTATWTVTASPV